MSSGAPSHGYALRSRGSPLKINNIYTINNNNNNNKSIEHNVDVKEPKKKEKVPDLDIKSEGSIVVAERPPSSSPPQQETSSQSSSQSSSQREKEKVQEKVPIQKSAVYAPSSWGYVTSKGGRKENQDCYVVPPNDPVDMKDSSTLLLFGVFDGHGFKGFEAAKEAGRCIENYIAYVNKQTEASLKNQEWLNNSLKDAFQNAQNTLIQIETSSKQMLDYGTTACVVLVRPALNEATIGWVGDARASVIRWENVITTPRLSESTDIESDTLRSATSSLSRESTRIINDDDDDAETYSCSPFLDGPDDEEKKGSSPTSSSTTVDDFGPSPAVQPVLAVAELTADHTPLRDDERTRVKREGGILRKVGSTWRVVAGGDYTEEQLKQQRLALNITRSLGHIILSKYGISAEPDILQTTLQHDDILVIASDGLWNELTSSEISAVTLECKMAGFSPQKLCNMLLRKCEVVSKLKGSLSDNITIVVYHHESC